MERFKNYLRSVLSISEIDSDTLISFFEMATVAKNEYLVEEGKVEEFKKALVRLISEIKERAEPIDPKEIMESDIIVPPEDLSFEEAKAIFKEPGIIED